MIHAVCHILSVALLLGIAASGVRAGEKAPEAPAVTTVTPEEFDKARKKEGAVVIDVRSPEEYAAGRVPNAVNIPVTGKGSEQFEKKIAEASKGKTPMIYCRSGSRSARAVAKMREMGIKSIIEMPGGWVAWTRAEKEVERGPAKQ